MTPRPRPRRPLACTVLLSLLLGSAACVQEDGRVLHVALPADVTAPDDAPAGSVNEGGVYTRLIERWKEDNEGWDVQIHWLSPEADDQRSQMAVAMQSDQLTYDVLALDNQWVPEFAERDWLVDVDLGGGFLGRAREAVCYEGDTWATPFHMDVGLLYYRADLVDPDEITARIEKEGWSGLLELAGEERDEHGLEHGYAGQFADYEGLTVNTLEFVLGGYPGSDSGGQGAFHGEDEEAECPTTTSASGSFEGLAVIEEHLDLEGPEDTGVIPRAALEETETESLNRFHDGEVVFMRHWPHVVSDLQVAAEGTESLREGLRWVGWGGEAESDDDAFGVLRLPTAVLGGNSLAVTEESGNEDRARDLVGYLTSTQAQGELRAFGLLPARGSGYELTDAEDTEIEHWRELRRAVDAGRLRPRTPYYPYVSEVLRGHVHTQLREGASDPYPEDMVCDLGAALSGTTVSTCD